VAGHADLVQVVGALDAAGGRPHLLHRGQEQPDEDADDSDHYQQLDQRETATLAHGKTPSVGSQGGGVITKWL
jgi:hypothetical protein